MVHQHFKLVDCFTVLDNIIMGVEPTKHGFLQKKEAREKVLALSEKYGLHVDPDALIEDITVGMQQRTEILKMLYRDNEILIFDEPTAVLTPQEIDELMQIMKNLAAEGKSILFISHKLAEIMAVADRCTVLRKGKYIGTVNTKDTTPAELSAMMVGRTVNFHVEKKPAEPGDRLHCGYRRQRPDGIGLRPDRSGTAGVRRALPLRAGHHPHLHPQAEHHGHEPHP